MTPISEYNLAKWISETGLSYILYIYYHLIVPSPNTLDGPRTHLKG